MALDPLDIAALIEAAPQGEKLETAQKHLQEYEGEDKELIEPALIDMAIASDEQAADELEAE